MLKKSKEFSGLSGLCEAGLEGNTTKDAVAQAVAAALKNGLPGIREELDGLAARVAVFEGEDILRTIKELTELKATVEGLQALKDQIPEDKSEELKSLAAKLDGVQAQILSGAAAPGGAQKPKSVGELVFEDEGFQAMISKSPSHTKAHKINLSEFRGKNALSVPDILAGVSAAPVLGDADLGALRWSTRQVEIVTEPKEDVAAFVPAIGVIPAPGFQVYEWPYETTDSATGYLRTTLSVALSGGSTPTDTAEVADASHFVPGTYVRFFDADRVLLGRLELVSVDTASTPNQLIFATGAINWDQDADTNITSEHWLGTPESEGKPYTLLAGDTTSVNAVTIAIMTAVTRQQLLSPSGIMAWINDELPDRTIRNIAQQLLYGAGTTGKSLLGFWSHPDATARTYKWSEGTIGDNRLDAVMRAVLMVVGGAPSIVMNKRDLQELRLLKDANDGQYLHSMILGKVSLEKVNGQWVLDGEYPIIKSEAVKDGDFLICDFASASKIIDAQDEALEFGVINDDFSLNQRRARYERTLAHAIQRTNSFVLGLWDDPPST